MIRTTAEQTIADIRLRIERLFQFRHSSRRPQRKTNDFRLTLRDIDGFIQIRFAVVEKENDIGRFAPEVVLNLHLGRIAGVARVQNRDGSVTGNCPLGPTMHRRKGHIHALVRVRSKKQIDDFWHRRFARPDEEKSRSPLLEE